MLASPPLPNRSYLEMAGAQSDLSRKMFHIHRALRSDVPWNRLREDTQLKSRDNSVFNPSRKLRSQLVIC